MHAYKRAWGKFIPDGLVGNDDLFPLLLAELLGDSVELAGDDLDGLVGLTLLHKSRVLAGCIYKSNSRHCPDDPHRDENEKTG